MDLPPFLAAVVGWLRAGYPEGVPEQDYQPLFALLGTHLTDDHLAAVAEEMASGAEPGPAAAIRAARDSASAAGAAGSRPPTAALARVSARLAAGGWPLARPPES
ncbi:hypothetical protein BIV57_18530 [Mangrovactinospora gilvigrisea]|uniref:DUF3349 domain-containing protein n=1 Tax=Mangrovactinospora gilvigrisea TaxID=1428644 RepID=A0A1J7C8R3_9ACTN|nr:DUF3349 domain-containing protein [Mangrovactinospora gilvigrisea]OIV36018.1 hypothetical protein BIV57_18530 [Mangrovactinospora gilvigrisea]